MHKICKRRRPRHATPRWPRDSESDSRVSQPFSQPASQSLIQFTWLFVLKWISFSWQQSPGNVRFLCGLCGSCKVILGLAPSQAWELALIRFMQKPSWANHINGVGALSPTSEIASVTDPPLCILYAISPHSGLCCCLIFESSDHFGCILSF